MKNANAFFPSMKNGNTLFHFYEKLHLSIPTLETSSLYSVSFKKRQLSIQTLKKKLQTLYFLSMLKRQLSDQTL